MHLADLIVHATGCSSAVVVAGHALRVRTRKLPDGAVCAMVPRSDGETFVVYDPDKPGAVEHTAAMLRGHDFA